MCASFPPAPQLALKGVEETNEDAMLVVLSDVWLDQPLVMAKLQTLFEGYAQMEPSPAAFVLMGNFTSQPYGRDHHRILRGACGSTCSPCPRVPTLCMRARFHFFVSANTLFVATMQTCCICRTIACCHCCTLVSPGRGRFHSLLPSLCFIYDHGANCQLTCLAFRFRGADVVCSHPSQPSPVYLASARHRVV